MYFFRKKSVDRPLNINLKIMHVINAIAILLFLGGIGYKLIQWFVLR